MDEWINHIIDRTLDSLAGRIAWALLSVGVIYACAFYFASILGGLS